MYKRMSAVLLSVLMCLSCSRERGEKTVLTAPFGPLAYPFAYMAENMPSKYEFRVWMNPDQLRAMITGKQADFFALPTNVAAVFHNKGADLTLLGVSLWKVMWIVSSDSTNGTLQALRGEEIVVPFRGDMPHIVFADIARNCGFDPETDFVLRFVNSPQDAVQQLIAGRAGNAVLAEPDLSILMYKTGLSGGGTGGTRRFYRVVDIQKEWDRIHGTGAEIPFGGVAVSAATAADTDFVRDFQRDYARAVEWCVLHPEETAELVARRFDWVRKEPIVEAMKHIELKFVPAAEAREAVETFFSVLLDGNPRTIGGKLPDDGFYWRDDGAR